MEREEEEGKRGYVKVYWKERREEGHKFSGYESVVHAHGIDAVLTPAAPQKRLSLVRKDAAVRTSGKVCHNKCVTAMIIHTRRGPERLLVDSPGY